MSEIKSKSIELVDISKIVPNPKNSNRHSIEQIKRLEKLIEYQGFRNPLVVSNRTGFLLAGHGRLEAAKNLNIEQLPVVYQDFDDEAQEYAYLVSDNEIARWAELDMQSIYDNLELTPIDDIDLLGIEDFKLPDIDKDSEKKEDAITLADKFGVPPFSYIDCRQGYYQDRRKKWLALGVSGEKGRKECLTFQGGNDFLGKENEKRGTTSVFCPALTELLYSWFCPSGGAILDPFAGGITRGFVAAYTKRVYVGSELSEDQVIENRNQFLEIGEDCEFTPVWNIGDSRFIDKTCDGFEPDFVFSCPPYADLEVYSDDPCDISNMSYENFIDAYREIIKKSCSLLKDDSFACFVVGEARGKDGNYYNFVGDTVRAFTDAGLSFYNEIIKIDQSGTGALRANKQMEASRKVVKMHQNILVFVKGDARKATNKCGDVYISELFNNELEND